MAWFSEFGRGSAFHETSQSPCPLELLLLAEMLGAFVLHGTQSFVACCEGTEGTEPKGKPCGTNDARSSIYASCNFAQKHPETHHDLFYTSGMVSLLGKFDNVSRGNQSISTLQASRHPNLSLSTWERSDTHCR